MYLASSSKSRISMYLCLVLQVLLMSLRSVMVVVESEYIARGDSIGVTPMACTAAATSALFTFPVQPVSRAAYVSLGTVGQKSAYVMDCFLRRTFCIEPSVKNTMGLPLGRPSSLGGSHFPIVFQRRMGLARVPSFSAPSAYASSSRELGGEGGKQRRGVVR